MGHRSILDDTPAPRRCRATRHQYILRQSWKTLPAGLEFGDPDHMGENVQQVLVIDDDTVSRKTVEKYLHETCNTEFAVDGEEGLKKATELAPDIILLDVEMPGMNGYMVCEQLKQSEKTRDIPVIFLSGHQTTQEKLLGYEAGADDFLIKPFEPDILLTKIKLLDENQKKHEQLVREREEAQKTALVAMTGSSELGQILQFVEKTLPISDYNTLAEAVFNVTSILDLNCCLLFQVDPGGNFYSSDGSNRPLEKDIMLKLSDEGRFYDFGCRTQINYRLVCLLIKNMPLEDSDHYGRVKDLLPFLLACTDAKLQSIKARDDLRSQIETLSGTMDLVRTDLAAHAQRLQDSQEAAVKILRNLLREYDLKIPTLGLDDDQETFLLDSLDKAIDNASHQIDSSELTRQGFEGVLKLLQHVVDSQNQLMREDRNIFEPTSEFPGGENGGEHNTTDIELF